ncbi:MAG TPA: prolyl oligopeptidase family serine peptidase, partial [Saprospiraceae bacterium]|nr:prolyl oligopeptidase family serine peptidase [Saprospiraceae bacterium]
EKKEKKEKTPSKKNGFPLIVRKLMPQEEDTLPFVTDVSLSKFGTLIAAYSTGVDSILKAGMYVYNCKQPEWRSIKTQKGTYKNFRWSEKGDQLAFVADIDTSKAEIRPYALYRWITGMDSAEVFVKNKAPFMSEGWQISENYKLGFSENGTKLHFGIAPQPLVEDTTLLEEERVSVEVWNYQDARLYTQQNVRVKGEKERAYHCIADLNSEITRQVANEQLPDTKMDRDGNSLYVVLYDEAPYLKESSWTGDTWRDIWIYDIVTGQHRLIGKAVEGMPQLSPAFKFVYWYHAPDSAWFVSPVKGNPQNISQLISVPVCDELNDVPANPGAYGVAGWTSGDASLLIYDRYDIWKVDPSDQTTPVNLTNGRTGTIRYRYIRLNPEEREIDPARPMLLHTFNETSKAEGYAELDLRTGQLRQLLSGDLRYDRSPLKARDAEVIVYTTESFQQFPDLQVTTDRFTSSRKISFVNPQQSEYTWGTIELYSWTAYDGQRLHGLLVKPEGFDPAKKYPLIVNFYERNSDELHAHRAPYPHRSTINYTFYTSRGYVIFNPDVPYTIGHPGESAFNAVVSGTQTLVDEGFINPQRMALQGHSWGGYQVAHILTKTGIYACAEAGAVVVNMTSAYGGIRWETGLSRMFQYEHQQSRIGGSLWEKPELYMENSPLFRLDKISTPVLILQNDSDGHVPWYQGIEFFTGMRRLGKPAWLLNYNGEPHWPVKLQNRKDFNLRMQQFFDHYLLDAPMPRWMRDGVPAVEKGILQGYELIERN